jgi:hypothetical protein
MFSVVKLPIKTHPVLNISSILFLMGNCPGKKKHTRIKKEQKKFS